MLHLQYIRFNGQDIILCVHYFAVKKRAGGGYVLIQHDLADIVQQSGRVCFGRIFVMDFSGQGFSDLGAAHRMVIYAPLTKRVSHSGLVEIPLDGGR
jgi:hypothetical protein